MKNNNSFNWRADWFQYWLWGPIVAHYLSWATGILSVVSFPILLTIAQFLSFSKNSLINKTHRWFYWLIPATYIWLKFGPVPPQSGSFGVGQGILNYYAGQVIATSVLMFMISPKLIYNWIIGNILAASLWYGCYLIPFYLNTPIWLSGNFGPALYLFFPAISLLSNAVTGYFLFLSTKPTPYEIA